MRQAFLEPRNDVTTPKKTWSTFVSTYRSFSDPETLCAKVHLLDVDNNFDSKTDLEDDGLAEDGAAAEHDEWEEEDTERLMSELGSIRETMAVMEEQRETNEVKLRHIREWRIIAVVLDRLFFLVYVTVNALGVAAIFLRVTVSE